MWCWSDENAVCSRYHAEQDEDNHEWTNCGTHFQEVGELRVCGRKARSGGNIWTPACSRRQVWIMRQANAKQNDGLL